MRTRLEADGIKCFLAGEALASVVGSPSYVGVSIDVQVQDCDAVRASDILQEIENAPRDEAENKDENWVSVKPNFAVQVLRGLLQSGAIWCMTWWTIGATNNWTAGVLAGALTLAILCVLQLKNSF